jgi:hypothetical protein
MRAGELSCPPLRRFCHRSAIHSCLQVSGGGRSLILRPAAFSPGQTPRHAVDGRDEAGPPRSRGHAALVPLIHEPAADDRGRQHRPRCRERLEHTRVHAPPSKQTIRHEPAGQGAESLGVDCGDEHTVLPPAGEMTQFGVAITAQHDPGRPAPLGAPGAGECDLGDLLRKRWRRVAPARLHERRSRRGAARRARHENESSAE